MEAVKLPYSSGIRRTAQVQFSGYQHTAGCSEGQIWDEKNISGRSAPYLRPVRQRPALEHACDNALFAHDAMGWVNGTELWYDGHLVGYVEDSNKDIAIMGNRIVIWPDKVVLNASYKRLGVYATLAALQAAVTAPKEFDAYGVGTSLPYEIYVWNGTSWVSNGKELESLEARESFAGVTFQSGTYKDVPADANTMEFHVDVTKLGFQEGDAVAIRGCTKHPENNKTAIIREIEGTQMRFYEYAFTLDGEDKLTDYQETGTITISREIPEMDMICAVDNRLWGAKDDRIFASKLGDPSNFNVFDGLTTDSWFQDTGTAGEFTGCIPYLGVPMFFKEGHIFKVYGKNAENFQPSKSATMGVKRGAGKSLAIAGEVLYYLSDNGLTAYTGGVPQSAAAPFGQVRYQGAVCGSDGQRLYMSMERANGETELFCLDTDTGLLHKEDGLDAAGFCCFGGVLYALKTEGSAVAVNEDAGEAMKSMVEFGDFYEQTMNRKETTRLQIRAALDAGAELKILVKYDSGELWRTVKTMTATKKMSFYLPVRIRRCDHYRIRLEGKGYWELLSMAREFHVGSEVH